jgi:hypothetical protein
MVYNVLSLEESSSIITRITSALKSVQSNLALNMKWNRIIEYFDAAKFKLLFAFSLSLSAVPFILLPEVPLNCDFACFICKRLNCVDNSIMSKVI